MDKTESKKLGREGERRAQAYLREQGYEILHCNWFYGHDELDVVCRYDNMLVVVEVKTRSSGEYERPEDAVSMNKIRHIVQATQGYIETFQIELPVRFDVISLQVQPDRDWLLEHFIDAFYPPVNC